MKTLKNPFFITSMFLFVTLTFSSCKKCSHCTIKDSNGSTIKDYGEKCGTSTDVNDYENSSKKDAVQYGGTFTCTK